VQWRRGLSAAIAEIDFVDLDNAGTAIEMLRDGNYALFLAEPLQGSSGNATWRSDALAEVVSAARQNGTLVAFDEVMTGLGRTGTWFAFQQLVPCSSPDLLIVSKGLTGGLLPVSAVLMTEPVYDAVFGKPGQAKSHGSTFSGYHLGLSVARATVAALTALDIPARVREQGAYLDIGLAKLKQKYSQLSEVRGTGLAWALGIADDAGPSAEGASQLCVELIHRNILVSVAANEPHWLRLTPPLNISTSEIDRFLDGLDLSLLACQS
jgi:acetylornithine/succinyldiaminopimelate/putrescine aminotransferase